MTPSPEHLEAARDFCPIGNHWKDSACYKCYEIATFLAKRDAEVRAKVWEEAADSMVISCPGSNKLITEFSAFIHREFRDRAAAERRSVK